MWLLVSTVWYFILGFSVHIDSFLPAPQHAGPSQALTLCLPQAEGCICPSRGRAWAVQTALSQRPGWGSVLCQAAGPWFVSGLHSWEGVWGIINSLVQKYPSQNVHRPLYRLHWGWGSVPSRFISSYFSRDIRTLTLPSTGSQNFIWYLCNSGPVGHPRLGKSGELSEPGGWGGGSCGKGSFIWRWVSVLWVAPMCEGVLV